jgi:transposase
MCAYSPDLRAKIVAAVERDGNKHAVAATFGVGVSTVKRYWKQWREEGSLAPKPHSGRPPTIRPDQEEALRAQVAEHPAAYLDEHCALWEVEHGVQVSLSAMSRAIRKVGFTRKKGRWVPVSGMSNDAASGTASFATSTPGA